MSDKVHVVEVVEKTNKNGDPYWDIKAEIGGRVQTFRDRVPRVEWQSGKWYEVDLAERQPMADRPGLFYLAEVLLAFPGEPPAAPQPPTGAPVTDGANGHWAERDERIMRGNALNAAAAAVPLIVAGKTVAEAVAIVLEMQAAFLPRLRDANAMPESTQSVQDGQGPPKAAAVMVEEGGATVADTEALPAAPTSTITSAPNAPRIAPGAATTPVSTEATATYLTSWGYFVPAAEGAFKINYQRILANLNVKYSLAKEYGNSEADRQRAWDTLEALYL